MRIANASVSENANAHQASPSVAALQDQIATLTAALKACQGTTSTATKREAVTRPAKAGIDRSKFDAVYRAGKAVNAAQFGDINAQFRTLLLNFETEASIASDKASGLAEGNLASTYHTAQLQFQAGLITRDATQRQARWAEASSTLAKADKIYLGK